MHSQTSTAVLIHGYNLQADGWKEVVSSRIQTGVTEAVVRQAQLIFWGSGASKNESGVKESVVTFRLATGELLADLAKKASLAPKELETYLRQVSIIDQQSQNT